MRTILIEGSSSAAGWYDHERGGWPARLNADIMPFNINNPYDPIFIRNEAVPGRTIKSILGEFGDHAFRFIRAGQLITVLAVGYNEAKLLPSESGTPRPRVTLDDFKGDLQMYSELAATLGTEEEPVPTVFVGPEPFIGGEAETPQGATISDDRIQEFGAAIAQEAADTGMPYVDARAILQAEGWDATISRDGSHPNAYGHALMAGAIRDALISVGMPRLDRLPPE